MFYCASQLGNIRLFHFGASYEGRVFMGYYKSLKLYLKVWATVAQLLICP